YSQNQFGMAVASGAAAPGVAPTGAEPSRVEPSRAEPSRVEPSRVEPSRVEPTSSVSRSLTDEERTFRRGIETLKSGGSVNARTSFEEYLRQYPNGTFSQDARFHLIRLVYAQGDIRQTVALGHEFLRISGDVGIRSNEVRLLVARGLMQQGNASDEAFTLLSPLMGGASTSREGYAEEIVYLYVLAAERTSRHGEARSWAAHYLHRYPTGRYVEEVTKIARQ
ncbi:MAG TPA: outer membrane protein assembly factor BamD, partial [Polyangiaceae bacterium]|nr:outer membrane protein assembly factor BamD [Polyangiaceae bacterium]